MQSSLSQQQQQKNATYTDMKRAWSSCPSDQLHLVLESTQSVSAVVDATVKENTTENLVQASAEILHTVARNNKSGGRTLQDAIVVVDSEGNVDGASDLAKDSSAAVSALQAPVLFIKKAEKKGEADVDPASGSSSEEPALLLCSSVAETSVAAATSMRRYLETRTKCHGEAMHIRSLQRSLQLQQDNLVKIEQERSNLLARNCIHGTAENFEATALAVQLDEIKAAEQNCARVIAQLQRQLPFLQRTHETDSEGLVVACAMASKDFSKSKAVLQNYRDPVGSSRRPTFLNNRILMNLCQRQLGIDRCLGRGIPRAMGRIRAAGATCENRKALLYNRFSHAATINTHLSYPVYCLRFDRTGRYFITGADDYLVKVFCFGGSVVVKKHGLMDPAAYARGAVLVCTLKGHAGVINDIGVSSDNSFLATASEDGDCRVWGLKDGCPVAILRGHTGGANMVS
jgi:WD domain, G-beta repeat